MRIQWEPNASVKVAVQGDEVTLSTNRDGLLSLSRLFADLAEEPPGSHIHFDEYNSLEEHSAELIVARLE